MPTRTFLEWNRCSARSAWFGNAPGSFTWNETLRSLLPAMMVGEIDRPTRENVISSSFSPQTGANMPCTFGLLGGSNAPVSERMTTATQNL